MLGLSRGATLSKNEIIYCKCYINDFAGTAIKFSISEVDVIVQLRFSKHCSNSIVEITKVLPFKKV